MLMNCALPGSRRFRTCVMCEVNHKGAEFISDKQAISLTHSHTDTQIDVLLQTSCRGIVHFGVVRTRNCPTPRHRGDGCQKRQLINLVREQRRAKRIGRVMRNESLLKDFLAGRIKGKSRVNNLYAWRHNMPPPLSSPRGRPSASRAAEQTQRSSTLPRRIRSHADRCSRLTR